MLDLWSIKRRSIPKKESRIARESRAILGNLEVLKEDSQQLRAAQLVNDLKATCQVAGQCESNGDRRDLFSLESSAQADSTANLAFWTS
jgi:hypothetical protein